MIIVSDLFIQESYKYLHYAWKTSQRVDCVRIKYQRDKSPPSWAVGNLSDPQPFKHSDYTRRTHYLEFAQFHGLQYIR